MGTHFDLLDDCPLCCLSAVGGSVSKHTTFALRASPCRFSYTFKHPWQPINLMKVLLGDTEKRKKWVEERAGQGCLWGKGKNEGCHVSAKYSGEKIGKYFPHAREISFKHIVQVLLNYCKLFMGFLRCSFLGLEYPVILSFSTVKSYYFLRSLSKGRLREAHREITTKLRVPRAGL